MQVQVPDLTRFLSIGNFLKFWDSWVPVGATYFFGALLLLSVYLRTRSATATAVVAVAMAAVWPGLGGLGALVAGAALGYILYKVFYARD